MNDRKSAATRLVQLEKKVDVAMKGLDILLFKDAEEISPRERKLLGRRLKDYTSREFVKLSHLQSHTAQESN
jgi:hypothetical protein